MPAFSTLFHRHLSATRRSIREGRPCAGGALLWGDARAILTRRVCAEHDANPARDTAHLDDLISPGDRSPRCMLAHRHRPSVANWGENFQLPQLFAGVILLAAVAIASTKPSVFWSGRCSTGERDIAAAEPASPRSRITASTISTRAATDRFRAR